MKLPFIIASQEKEKGLEQWNKIFVKNGRNIHEGVWRRTQDKKNAEFSQWKNEDDKRLRVVHFVDHYSVISGEDGSSCCLALIGAYLRINHTLPISEAKSVFKRYRESVKIKNLEITIENTNELINKIGDFNIHLRLLESEKDKNFFPIDCREGYAIVDVEIRAGDLLLEEEQILRPWNILKKGFRIPAKRGVPIYIDSPKQLLQYAPFQIELGCGPSTEVGIPPLSYLHKIYQTSDVKIREFIFGENDFLFEEIIGDLQKFYQRATKIMSTSWLAEPKSSFYSWLKWAYEKGLVVGPVITNNYDGLTSLLGLPELYVRKFTDPDLIPTINFHPKAKSLLVIGVHADRRLIQEAARTRGLKVIFIDPEKYIDEQGVAFDYPLEAPQDNDLVFRKTASEFGKLMSV